MVRPSFQSTQLPPSSMELTCGTRIGGIGEIGEIGGLGRLWEIGMCCLHASTHLLQHVLGSVVVLEDVTPELLPCAKCVKCHVSSVPSATCQVPQGNHWQHVSPCAGLSMV